MSKSAIPEDSDNTCANDEQPKKIKLPYFHRSLSQEEASIIGDCKPQLLSTSLIPDTYVTPSVTSASSKSVWNGADTWEEYDRSRQATETFREELQSESCKILHLGASKTKASIEEVVITQCQSQIAHVRGRIRLFYEISAEIQMEIELPDGSTYEGTLGLTELSNDQSEDDYDLSWKWKDKLPPNSVIGQLKKEILGKVTKSWLKSCSNIFEVRLKSI